MDISMNKRARTRNFIESEKKLLLNIVQQNLDLVEEKSSKCKIKIWQNISEEFNNSTIFGFRTWKQLRHLYKNMKKGRSHKNGNGSLKKITPTIDRISTLIYPRSESLDDCNNSSNVYYDDIPVIIESVPSKCNRQDPKFEITVNESVSGHSYISDTFFSDNEPSTNCSKSKASSKARNTNNINFNRNMSNFMSEHKLDTEEDILWKRMEFKFKSKVYEHKLKAMKEIHEQELKAIQEMNQHVLKAKKELHEQELLMKKENHALEKDIKMKLLELESANWLKRNKLLDLEITLKEKQLNM